MLTDRLACLCSLIASFRRRVRLRRRWLPYVDLPAVHRVDSHAVLSVDTYARPGIREGCPYNTGSWQKLTDNRPSQSNHADYCGEDVGPLRCSFRSLSFLHFAHGWTSFISMRTLLLDAHNHSDSIGISACIGSELYLSGLLLCRPQLRRCAFDGPNRPLQPWVSPRHRVAPSGVVSEGTHGIEDVRLAGIKWRKSRISRIAILSRRACPAGLPHGAACRRQYGGGLDQDALRSALGRRAVARSMGGTSRVGS